MGCGNCKQMSTAQAVHGAVQITKATLGIGVVPEAVRASRGSKCGTCEHAVPCEKNPQKKCWCSVCHCLLGHKIKLKDERCPLPEPRWVEHVD